eukprot:Em0326g4a
MKAEDAGNYQLVKEAILRRYDISEQTYRQRFRDAVMKKDETVGRTNVRLTDLFLKWTKGCKTVEQLRDLMILEQLVNTLQTEVRVWVTERNPKTSAEAAKLADDYLSARKQNGSRLVQERKFDQKATVDGKKKTASETVPRQGSEPKGDSATQMAVGKRTLRGKVETSEAFATTRAASRRRVEEEREQARREKSSGVLSWMRLFSKEEEQRPTQTRSQKRQKRQEHSRRMCPQLPADTGLNLSASELQKLQETDPTLSALRKVSGREVDSGGGGSDVSVVVKNGLMYRVKARTGELPGREQLWYQISVVGSSLSWLTAFPSWNMGRNKTIGTNLQRFYWPTVYKDVAEFCKRFPEAVPMRSIDAENVAEELLKLFARVGIPVEILTDQGANFTSQLLSELYSMLHIHGIRTTPYHPQTDGLVERFNQTLKACFARLQFRRERTGISSFHMFYLRIGKYHRAQRVFSPFELLYGREVRGPLDVVKESWEASERSNQSVVSYVVNIREKVWRR